MNVGIKKFDVEMAIKNNGIELEVREPNDGDHRGDLVITKTKLIWCSGRTGRAHGRFVEWDAFINYMNQQPRQE